MNSITKHQLFSGPFYNVPNSYKTLSNGMIMGWTQRIWKEPATSHDLIDILPLNVHEGTEEMHTKKHQLGWLVSQLRFEARVNTVYFYANLFSNIAPKS
jgi:hypothetical protein